MRILAIRGRNLTALAGDFAVDFESDPLAAAGLFAITGPTGAGKSTLLDALCIALYDRFPRLDNAARVAVGAIGADETLQVMGTDPRTILRHGEATGFAEVDFAGRDGGRYRARWEVRRARNRVEGKLQSQSVSLLCLTTERQLGGTKTETLPLIADKVGLTFDQFRRSVLLAQGDFDAFLKAKPGDRADLLELMTGTAIYGDLSRAAHARAKAEREALEALDTRRRALNLLTEEERATAEEAARTAEAETKAAQAALDALKAQRQWYATAEQHRQAVEDGAKALAEAEAAQEAAADDRTRLETIRRLGRLRSVVEAADRLCADHDRLATERTAAESRKAKAERDRAALTTRCTTAADACTAAEAALKEAAPQLDAAAALDTRITTARDHRDRCADAETRAAARVQDAEKALADHARAHAETSARAGEADRWLSDHAGRRLLAEQIDRWMAELEDWAEAAASRDAARARAESLATRISDLERNHAKRDVLRAETEEAIRKAEADLKPLVARMEALDPEALEDRRSRTDATATALATLVRLAEQAAEQAERRADLDRRRAEADTRLSAATEALAEVERQRTPLDQRLSEARRALDVTAAAGEKAAAALRAKLVDGQPCPVCGAEDHPYAHDPSPFDELVTVHRDRVASLEAEMKALDVRERQALADQGIGQATRNACAEEARRLDHSTKALHAAWEEARHGIADLPADPAAADRAALTAREAEARAALETVVAAQQEVTRLRKDIDNSRTRIADHRLQLDQVRELLAGVGQNLATAQAQKDAAEAEATQAARALENADAALDGPLAEIAGWRDDARSDAAALTARCRTLAAGWHDHRTMLEAARAALARLDGEIKAAEVDARGCREAAASAAAEKANAETALADLESQRASLFGGEATAAVRARLEGARDQAQAALTAEQAALSEARSACAAATHAAADLADRLARAVSDRDTALAARDSALADAGATLDETRAALAHAEETVAALEARLKELDTTASQAAAVLTDRRRALDEHLATPAPDIPAEALAEQIAAAEETCETHRTRAAAERARLDHDRQQRLHGDEIARQMEAQRKVSDLWGSVSHVIGSADGSRFRRFAQSLTLDRLLSLANAHLGDLTPRYALQRAPGGDLDLQVIDREMGDEVRGVGSLSGGERFLVSLALALGLASMSGERTLVESLFIDEGFGALDAASLDIALSALEALQASGRKVGVISHVQAMVDRISVQVRVSKAGGGRSVVETVVG